VHAAAAGCSLSVAATLNYGLRHHLPPSLGIQVPQFRSLPTGSPPALALCTTTVDPRRLRQLVPCGLLEGPSQACESGKTPSARYLAAKQTIPTVPLPRPTVGRLRLPLCVDQVSSSNDTAQRTLASTRAHARYRLCKSTPLDAPPIRQMSECPLSDLVMFEATCGPGAGNVGKAPEPRKAQRLSEPARDVQPRPKETDAAAPPRLSGADTRSD
jgi:hypothetical protein